MNEKPTVDRRIDCVSGRENVTREAVSGEVFEILREHNCRDCKGFFGPDDNCPESCDQMQAALAVEVLGLTEHWDGFLSPSGIVSTGQAQLLVRLARERLKEADREKPDFEAIKAALDRSEKWERHAYGAATTLDTDRARAALDRLEKARG